jgi:hypothetical protein
MDAATISQPRLSDSYALIIRGHANVSIRASNFLLSALSCDVTVGITCMTLRSWQTAICAALIDYPTVKTTTSDCRQVDLYS